MGIAALLTNSAEQMLPIQDKNRELKKYNAVKEWEEGAIQLYIQGDTAVFCFNSFVNEVIHPF